MLLLVAALGVVLVALGGLLLLLFPDRPGGDVSLLGLKVSSPAAGLPLIVLGTVLVAGAAATGLSDNEHVQATGCGLRITDPKEGKRVTNRGIVVVKGTACPNDDVWIFHYPGNGYYYRKNANPIDVIDGQWSHTLRYLGALDDPVGSRYQIVAVGAGRACSLALKTIPPDKDNEVRRRRLPAACPPWNSTAKVQSVVVVKGGGSL